MEGMKNESQTRWAIETADLVKRYNGEVLADQVGIIDRGKLVIEGCASWVARLGHFQRLLWAVRALLASLGAPVSMSNASRAICRISSTSRGLS
jgi:hypothetical protein